MAPVPASDDPLARLDHVEELLHRMRILALQAAEPACSAARRAQLQALTAPLLAALDASALDERPTAE